MHTTQSKQNAAHSVAHNATNNNADNRSVGEANAHQDEALETQARRIWHAHGHSIKSGEHSMHNADWDTLTRYLDQRLK